MTSDLPDRTDAIGRRSMGEASRKAQEAQRRCSRPRSSRTLRSPSEARKSKLRKGLSGGALFWLAA